MEPLPSPLPKHSGCHFHPYSHPRDHLMFWMFAMTSVWFEQCLSAPLCLCEQSTLIGWMVYMMGISCWGLILSDDRCIPAGNDSDSIMPVFESFFSSSLFLCLPPPIFIHHSTSPALNYELTARHNYDILASTLKMGAEQCSESLVSILIYQGHGVSVSDLTLSSFCFPLSISWNEDNRMAYLNWPITLESYFRFEAEQFSQT